MQPGMVVFLDLKENMLLCKAIALGFGCLDVCWMRTKLLREQDLRLLTYIDILFSCQMLLCTTYQWQGEFDSSTSPPDSLTRRPIGSIVVKSGFLHRSSPTG